MTTKCPDCGKDRSYHAKRCRPCSIINTVRENKNLSKQERSRKYGGYFNTANPMNDLQIRKRLSNMRKGKNNPMWRSKIRKVCFDCKSIFNVVPSETKRKFCSKLCANKHIAPRMKENNPMKIKSVSNRVAIKLKEKWKDITYKEAQIKKWRKSPNKLELALIKFFDIYNIPLKFTGNGKFWITSKSGICRCPDFINKDSKKVVLLCGQFWHPDDEIKEQILDYKSRGFEALVLKDREIIYGSFSPPYKLKESYILSSVNAFLEGVVV